jgi:hypothetical protein
LVIGVCPDLVSTSLSNPTEYFDHGREWTYYESVLEPGVDVLICCTAGSATSGLFLKPAGADLPPTIPPTNGDTQLINLKDFDACADGFTADTSSGVNCRCPAGFVHTTKEALLENCVCELQCKK